MTADSAPPSPSPSPLPSPSPAEPRTPKTAAARPPLTKNGSSNPNMNGPLYMQTSGSNVVLVRRLKRRDNGAWKHLARWFVENQIGMWRPCGVVLGVVFLSRIGETASHILLRGVGDCRRSLSRRLVIGVA